ncbi:MAG TPA: hypothetical protein VGI10_02785, partial [Polyangiaceae bacterium]
TPFSGIGGTVTALFFQNDYALGSVRMNVTTVNGQFEFDSNGVVTLDLPNLTSLGNSSVVTSNFSLVCLRLPLLTKVGTLSIGGDPSLPTCQATAIIARITSGQAGSYSLLDSGTCPSAACP